MPEALAKVGGSDEDRIQALYAEDLLQVLRVLSRVSIMAIVTTVSFACSV